MVLNVFLASSVIKSSFGFISSGVLVIPLLIGALTYYRYENFDPETRIIDQKHILPVYDFIVIGGGSSGAVIANRLSEVEKWKVLLIEAGPDENEISDVPSLSAYLQLSKLDWKYKTEPSNSSCLGMRYNRCNWPRGKVLGGSSVLNYMIYVRGNKHDFNHWASLGNEGWDYNNVLKYFKKSEDNRNPYLASNFYHGRGGLLTVQESPWHTPIVAAFIEAGYEIGYENRDINGEKQTGFMIAQGTIRRGSRCSTAKAFLRPIKLRPNVHFSLNSYVTKVAINPYTLKAEGVHFYKNGKHYYVRSKKEVILSAGALNTPQLLMLSGVGPSDHLQEVGIPVIKDLPGVGRNLQDHVGMGGLTFLVDKPITIIQDRFQPTAITTQYVLNERGPMTSLGGLEGVAFVNTKYSNHSLDWPDIQFHLAPASINSDGGARVKAIMGLKDSLFNSVYAPIIGRDSWTIIPLLLRPHSRGHVRLKTKNPLDYALFTSNYFADDRDIKTLVEGAKIALSVANAKVFKQFNSKVHSIPLPNCVHIPFLSDEYLECHARTISMTIYHPVGTAKMGVYRDPYAVVDPRLKVFGIQGLRVADASIMPTIVSGNTNAAVVMIGEKAADLIKEDWGVLYHPVK